MKKILLALLLLMSGLSVRAQLNTTLRSNFDIDDEVNDIWGYVAPDGTEYALMALTHGVAIISLADPDAPTLIERIEQPKSVWRDIKTYGDYAYVTADEGTIGLTVINLTQLPTAVTYETFAYELPASKDRPYVRAHNIYIDTTLGYAFTAGGDRTAALNRGGVLIFDLKENPAKPTLRALGPDTYAHDVYVQDNRMYASEIYKGELGIYDITDVDNITKLGETQTPYRFTHNAWSDQDGTTVFTTDEKGNASVAAYDISEPGDIVLLDEYRPLTSLNTGTIPHNAHFIDDYLSISYYTDGLRVVDASDPTNLIEVANYDTYEGPDGGFQGAWGAYPFLPSGLTLVSDRQRGLFVIDVDYKRAARLEGTVTRSTDGQPLNDARVVVLSDQINEGVTDAFGSYATGVAEAGSVEVIYSAVGYYADTLRIPLENGVTLRQDVELTPRPLAPIAVTLADRRNGTPLAGATLALEHDDVSYFAVAGQDGVARLDRVYDYDYDLLLTAWGYQLTEFADRNGATLVDGDTLFLEPGYEDTFLTDLGWTVNGTATTGEWERVTPLASFGYHGPGNPDGDSPHDIGNLAYVTDGRTGPGLAYDVDGGPTILTSPVMDLSTFKSAVFLIYDYWFTNASGGFVPNDSLTISISSGKDTTLLAAYGTAVSEWTRDTLRVDEYLPLTDSMHLIISVADPEDADNLVEAGFDNFRVLDSLILPPLPEDPDSIDIATDLFPNPAAGEFTLAYDFIWLLGGELEVFSAATGQRIHRQKMPDNSGTIHFGTGWPAGAYIGRITSGKHTLRMLKMIKL
ncbi:choice-of-anchor B family protein [Lewinella sp. IMCC34183]|uniref:choice-of-anchor B family protein n=1 Tax=Lewinella sp. IMCC34183 TaxID=2248762 RepID=UPI0018E54A5E|nr:choice-of-anchor B family protein [Lewinella sp. IMCC34183]